MAFWFGLLVAGAATCGGGFGGWKILEDGRVELGHINFETSRISVLDANTGEPIGTGEVLPDCRTGQLYRMDGRRWKQILLMPGPPGPAEQGSSGPPAAP